VKTTHEVHFGDSRRELAGLDAGSVGLAVTSPPYPMIEMWDEVFARWNPGIGEALERRDGAAAFDLMHDELAQVWAEVYRVLVDGGIACINVGDATRTLGGNFQLHANHARIVNDCLRLGFVMLPAILWRKQTNAPNKFMGSGMLPPGAYVTLEHEYVLIFRKGRKREFRNAEQKRNRAESAFFWEERNIWFSDVWDFKGSRQQLNGRSGRDRSAAFPFELAYRLVNMFSVKQDVVLDPFLGTGTTMLAALAAGRNSVGVELDAGFGPDISDKLTGNVDDLNRLIAGRLESHMKFVSARRQTNGELKHMNKSHGVPVVTRQETQLHLRLIESVSRQKENLFEATYYAKAAPMVGQLDLGVGCEVGR